MLRPKPIYRARDQWVLGQCLDCGKLNYCEPHGTTGVCTCNTAETIHRNIPYAYRDRWAGSCCIAKPPLLLLEKTTMAREEKTYTVYATATWRGAFPIDMLRRDQCYPVDASSVVAITASLVSPSPIRSRTATLAVNVEARTEGAAEVRGFTIDRWESFGVALEIGRIES